MVLPANEIEDEAVMALAVAVDAAHALFEPVRVPGDVVVEQDVAALKVGCLHRPPRSRRGPGCLPSRNSCSVCSREPGSSREPGLMPPWMHPTLKPHPFMRSMR